MEPWFEPNQYAWIPGTVFGCVAGVMAVFVSVLAPQGKARRAICGAWSVLWSAAILLLAAGLYARQSGQPWGVWYGLLLPGAIGTAVVGGNFLVILKRYREVEQRRLAAKDFL